MVTTRDVAGGADAKDIGYNFNLKDVNTYFTYCLESYIKRSILEYVCKVFI